MTQDENCMPTEQYSWLKKLHESGGLVQPEQPALKFARLALYGVKIVGEKWFLGMICAFGLFRSYFLHIGLNI
jgi:hypothetical protein